MESQPQMDEISWEANGREETCSQISMLKYKEEKEPVKKMNRGAGKLDGNRKCGFSDTRTWKCFT